MHLAQSTLYFLMFFAISSTVMGDVTTFSYSCETMDGKLLSLSYAFDTDTADTNTGNYSFASPDATVTVGTIGVDGTEYSSSSGTATLNIEVINDISMADEYNVAVSIKGLSGSISEVQANLELKDATATVFSSVTLPKTQPLVSSFTATRRLSVVELSSSDVPVFSSCELSVTAVPEPSGLSCLFLTASVIGCVHRAAARP